MITEPFIAFPKIPRLSKETFIITEKLDGTNAQVFITPEGKVLAGSRNRWLTPNDDNFGFAKWVEENKSDLLLLGPGRHFGEWYGSGIQRGYGLKEKRFALFNTWRDKESLPSIVEQVTVLWQATYEEDISYVIDEFLTKLKFHGSIHIPGFMKPEGVVVLNNVTGVRYKVLCENDNLHKGEQEK